MMHEVNVWLHFCLQALEERPITTKVSYRLWGPRTCLHILN